LCGDRFTSGDDMLAISGFKPSLLGCCMTANMAESVLMATRC
jgi:hypothetical protein